MANETIDLKGQTDRIPYCLLKEIIFFSLPYRTLTFKTRRNQSKDWCGKKAVEEVDSRCVLLISWDIEI